MKVGTATPGTGPVRFADALHTIRRSHRPRLDARRPHGSRTCMDCARVWPCATRRIADGALGLDPVADPDAVRHATVSTAGAAQ